MFSPIAISLSPNTQTDDVSLALKILFQPWYWLKGEAITKIENWFKKYFEAEQAISFNSGRAALYAILKSLGISTNDEVLIQAFTCVAVPNSILWTGAKPIFVDIKEKTFNLDPSDLKKKITSNSKAIIIQHTFGIPAEINKIKEIAKENNLILIEDCAHCLGGVFQGKKLGSFGDFAFFSFGRDKIISSVFGGMAIINKKLNIKNKKYILKMKDYNNRLKFPNRGWVFQQLLHPVAFSLILPLYNFFNLGKIALFLLQKLKLLSLPVYPQEKKGEKPGVFPKKMPNGLAILALNQLKKLEKFNQKRKKLASIYCGKQENITYLRYPILTKDAEKIYQTFKKRGILLGRWYANVIDPKGVIFKKIRYKKGSCPTAERAAERILNLPTYPRMSEKDALKIKKLTNCL